MQKLTIQPVGNLADLGARWQALEARANAGFFRSWTFLGCQAQQRFGHASLLAITQDGADVALGLLGHGGGRRWLNQTGDRLQDSVFIEHNGLLAASDTRLDLPAALRQAAGRGSLVLSGVDDATLASARRAGWLDLQQSRLAPSLRLDTLAALGRPYLDTLSPNARAQIRRSIRLYGGQPTLTRAATPAQAQAFFTEMVELHQASWRQRGQPGAFADAATRDFHTALIARAWALGQADLLRFSSGGLHVGTLYMLIRDGHVNSYQSGFAATRDAREKPGLVCHSLAIAHYAAEGAGVYDLLGGADRYKLTLASGGQMLHWATLHRPWSAGGLRARAASAIKQASSPFLKKGTQKLLSRYRAPPDRTVIGG